MSLSTGRDQINRMCMTFLMILDGITHPFHIHVVGPVSTNHVAAAPTSIRCCCRDRHGRSGPIVTCSNAAQLSRRYNVPLDHSRGFGKSRHSSDEHTCPLLALGCWMPVLQRLHGQIVVGELCGTVSSPVLLVLIPPKRGLGFQT